MRNWEAGATRIPYAAYKLMRVMRSGKVLGPEWRGFHVWYGVLHTPEGHRFEAGELAWWSLLVRRARAFSDLRAARDVSSERMPAAAAVRRSAEPAPACRPAGQQDEGSPDGSGQLLASLGLVYSSTSGTLEPPESGSTAENKANRAFPVVEAEGANGPALRASPRLDAGRLGTALRATGGAA